jgi:hypothetical protein
MMHANAIPMLTVPTAPGMSQPTVLSQAPFASCPICFVLSVTRRICASDPELLLSDSSGPSRVLPLAAVGIRDAQLEAAFSTVERERYLGPGPWRIPASLRLSGYA